MLLSPAPKRGLQVGGDAVNSQLPSCASGKACGATGGSYLKLRSVKWGSFSQLVPVWETGGGRPGGREKHVAELQGTKVRFTNTLEWHNYI